MTRAARTPVLIHDAGGHLAPSAGHRSSAGSVSSISPGESGVETRPAVRGSERSNLVDFLGSQPPSGNQILGDAPKAPDGEVALEVKSTNDTDLGFEAEGHLVA